MGKKIPNNGELRKDGSPTKIRKTDTQQQTLHLELVRRLRMGFAVFEIVDWLMAEHNFSREEAKQVMNNIRKELDEYYKAEMGDMARKNLERLENIISELYLRKEYKNLLTAIDLSNKTGQVYTQKVDITSNNQQFEIKIANG